MEANALLLSSTLLKTEDEVSEEREESLKEERQK